MGDLRAVDVISTTLRVIQPLQRDSIAAGDRCVCCAQSRRRHAFVTANKRFYTYIEQRLRSYFFCAL